MISHKVELLTGGLAPKGYKFVRQPRSDGRLGKKRLLYKVDERGNVIGDPLPFRKKGKAKQYAPIRDPNLPAKGVSPDAPRNEAGKWQPGHDGGGRTHVKKIAKGVTRRHAWNRIFRKFFKPERMEAVIEALYETATNQEDPQKVAAIKEILNRTLGKVKTTIDINETQTLTIEERKTRVLALLGVNPEDASLRFRDGSPAFQNEGDDGDGVAALPAAIPVGPLALPDLGEVPPSGDHLGECVEVGREADHAEEAARPPVQLEG